ncbi:MAG: Uncharacterised protein [Marine Group II euryarchaeote MED-G33]|nr:MAG: Uncharacterised protein [Marine Group II euryarchaeote MED-G33]
MSLIKMERSTGWTTVQLMTILSLMTMAIHPVMTITMQPTLSHVNHLTTSLEITGTPAISTMISMTYRHLFTDRTLVTLSPVIC